MFQKQIGKAVVGLLLAVVLAACSGNAGSGAVGGKDSGGKDSGGKAGGNSSVVGTEPIQLLVFSNFDETAVDFDSVFVNPTKKKYPNIDLKLMTNKDGKIDQLVASGQIPDIVVASVLNLNVPLKLGLLTDLNPLVKKNKFDLQRIEPAILNYVKEYSKKDELYGIPYTSNFDALYYNKDIFDKFGVAYPKDDMTWDQTVDLAKKLTRVADGAQYYGLDPEKIARVASPLEVSFVDKTTNKATIQAWKPAYELYNQINNIPGNQIAKDLKYNKDNFVKNQTVAMLAATNILKNLQEVPKLNWDLTTYPQYKDHPGTFGVAGARSLSISPNTKNKDAAFEVISIVLTDEVQKEASRNGINSPLKSLDVQKTFGENLSFMKGKNIPAIYKLKPSFRKISDYDDVATDIVQKHFIEITSGKDINTIIRETEEDINAAIAKEMAK
jgi:multiple sugar transport system substrate-binding protein